MNTHPLVVAKRRVLITAIVLLAAVTASLVYVYYGDDFIAKQIDSGRILIRNQLPDIDLEAIQQQLQKDYGLFLLPKSSIKLIPARSARLPHLTTLPPGYDRNCLYLAGGNHLTCLNKSDFSLTWQQTLPGNVLHLQLLPGNMLLAVTNRNLVLCLLRDTGKILWSHPAGQHQKYASAMLNPLQVYLEEDLVFSRSVLLFPDTNSLTLANTINGSTLYVYKAKQQIHGVSKFDSLEKTFWVIEGNRIVALELKK